MIKKSSRFRPASSRRKRPTSVTTPCAWWLPRSASLVTTAWLMSTQNVSTEAGSTLPVAMVWSVVASIGIPLFKIFRALLTEPRFAARGTRIRVGVTGSLKQILFGPAELDDGSQNLVGALATCMGNVGAQNVREFQETEIIIAPAIKTEGKVFQTVQGVGMGSK